MISQFENCFLSLPCTLKYRLLAIVQLSSCAVLHSYHLTLICRLLFVRFGTGLTRQVTNVVCARDAAKSGSLKSPHSPGESLRTSHLSLDNTSQATAENAHEAVPTENRCDRIQGNHLGHRTCDLTQRVKGLPTTRTRQTPHHSVMAEVKVGCFAAASTIPSRDRRSCDGP